jgi:vitamin B12 transporter
MSKNTRSLVVIVGLLLPAIVRAQGGQSSQNGNQSPPTLFETVIVSASRDEELTREVPNNVTVLDQEHIQTSTAQTVGELLVQEGFNSITYNDSSGVQIRGFGQLSGPPEYTNTVLILLNGRRTGSGNLTLTGLSNVERVEIIRGPSVQYGSSAMGGVINIITKRGAQDPRLGVEFGFGSDDLKREKFSFSGAGKGFDLAVGVSNYGRDDLTTTGDRRWYRTAVDHNVNADVDFGYSMTPNHRVGLGYNYGEVRSELPSGNGIRPYATNTPSKRFTAYAKDSDNTALTYNGNTSNKVWNWLANYSFGNYDQRPFTNYLDTRFFNAQGGFDHTKVSASFGFDTYQYESDPSSWSMKDNGAYGTVRVRPSEQLILSAGLRSDRFTNVSPVLTANDNHTGGSAGVAYLPRPWLKLRTNWAQGFKVPSPQQVAGDGAVFYQANLSLQPEKSNTVEFGGDIASDYVTAGLTWFHATWDNKILGVSAPGSCSGGFGCFQYVNLKSSTLGGLEGSVSSNVAKKTSTDFEVSPYLSFTWLQTRENGDASQLITFNGTRIDTLPNTPDWMVSYGVGFNHRPWKLSSRLNAAYYGTTLTQDWSVVDFVTVFSAPYIKRPTGTVVNLTAEKTLLTIGASGGGLGVRGEIVNLFDSANEVYWGYPGPGRGFYLGLRYDFGK